MLKKIRLRNFRTHKRTIVDFCSGINGIIGIGSSGKTNILRALILLARNRPLGNGVISRFAPGKNAVVDSEWTDDLRVKIVKGKKSYYQINDEKPFRKINTNVPEQVADALFLSDINFHKQFDGPFLVFSGPGEISKVINESTGANEFDIWLGETTKAIKELKIELKDAEYREEKYRIEIEKLEGVRKLAQSIKELKEITETIEEKQKEYDDLSHYFNTMIDLEDKIIFHKRIARFKVKLKRIRAIQEEYDELDDQATLIEDYEQKLVELKEAKKRHKRIVDDYIKLLVKKHICPTCTSTIKQSNVKSLREKLRV